MPVSFHKASPELPCRCAGPADGICQAVPGGDGAKVRDRGVSGGGAARKHHAARAGAQTPGGGAAGSTCGKAACCWSAQNQALKTLICYRAAVEERPVTGFAVFSCGQVLLPDEKRALLERYRVKDTQLPRIQFNDPVARYYGMSRGQVQCPSRPATAASRPVC